MCANPFFGQIPASSPLGRATISRRATAEAVSALSERHPVPQQHRQLQLQRPVRQARKAVFARTDLPGQLTHSPSCSTTPPPSSMRRWASARLPIFPWPTASTAASSATFPPATSPRCWPSATPTICPSARDTLCIRRASGNTAERLADLMGERYRAIRPAAGRRADDQQQLVRRIRHAAARVATAIPIFPARSAARRAFSTRRGVSDDAAVFHRHVLAQRGARPRLSQRRHRAGQADTASRE